MAVEGLKDRAARGLNVPGSPKTVVAPPPAGPAKVSPFAAQQASLDINSSANGVPSTTDRHFSVDALPKQPVAQDTLYALLSVVTLTLQCTATSIILRYSRTQAGIQYLPSVAVFITECFKLTICASVQLWRRRNAPSALDTKSSALVIDTEAGRGGVHATFSNGTAALAAPLQQQQQQQRRWQHWRQVATAQFRHALPMALPATMFVSQQVLLIAAATYLDAVTYQIFNQAFKLIPTAVFAYWLLGQQLEQVQWASIPVLSMGVILVTLNNSAGSAQQGRGAPVSQLNWFIGMASCCLAGLSSAFAGVYFEKYVKGRLSASLWVRNLQLGMFAVPFSAAWAWGKDGAAIRRDGWLQGFSPSACTVVALQVCGGLVTGCVVKYCNNVLKNFALAVSVVLTVLVSIPLFGQWPSGLFLVGVALVMLSVVMYSQVVDPARAAQLAGRAGKGWADTPARRRRAAAAALVFALSLLALSQGSKMQRGLPTQLQGVAASIQADAAD